MAINQITIVFTPCSPAPSEGYRVFYREVGEVDFIEHPDAFTSSPIIFQVVGPTDQPYEGYIVADCGDDLFSEEVPFETVPCPPPEGCCDPVVIDAEAETIIPDGSGSGSESIGGEFLRLVFNVDMSDESVSDWNVFFGFTFDNVVYSAGGTVVDLYLSIPLTISDSLFFNNMTLVRVLDFSNLVVQLGNQVFSNCDNLLEMDLPGCLTIGDVICFGCAGITDINLPLITNVATQAFAGTTVLTNFNSPLIVTIQTGAFTGSGLAAIDFPDCTTVEEAGLSGMANLSSLNLPNVTSVGEDGLSFNDALAVINLPSCTSIGLRCFRSNDGLTNLSLPVCSDLGGTTGDDEVFLSITGQTITFTLLTATAGDTDVTILQANNSVTLILV